MGQLRKRLAKELRRRRGEMTEREFAKVGSPTSVIEELDRRGWRNVNERRFTRESLRRLLTSRVLTGKVVFGGEVSNGQHEAIIDTETWDTVQRMLKRDKGRKQGRNPKSLLSGILQCGRCGQPMHFHESSKENRRYSYYVCRTARTRGASACPGSRVATHVVEARVVDRIRDVGRNPTIVATTFEAAKHELATRCPELEADLKQRGKERDKLERDRNNLLNALGAGSQGQSSVLERIGKLEKSIEEIAQRIDQHMNELMSLRTTVIDESDLRQALSTFDEVWNVLFLPERRRIISLLLDEVAYLADKSEIDIRFSALGVQTLARESHP